MQSLQKQNQTVIDSNDNHYRRRLQALQGIDDLVEGLVARLERYGIMDSTYFIYTTDNGYHIGQHRLPPGKTCPIEEDINIPLIIRGPGVSKNATADIVTTHTDIAPTIFDLLGIEQRSDFDGQAIPTKMTQIQAARERAAWAEHVNVEFWSNRPYFEGEYAHDASGGGVNTYKALRVIGAGYNLYYSVWCTNEHELYVSAWVSGAGNRLTYSCSLLQDMNVSVVPFFKLS